MEWNLSNVRLTLAIGIALTLTGLWLDSTGQDFKFLSLCLVCAGISFAVATVLAFYLLTWGANLRGV
jgi:hypothetical protein